MEVDSKRIQPSYAVGDKLVVLDSVNKESEVVVMDVQVKENQLKLLLHYIGWGDKWNEWIPVTSKRIVQRHSRGQDKDKMGAALGGAGGGAATSADGVLLSSCRPVRCSFELIGRVAEVVKVDASASSLSAYIGRKDVDASQLQLVDDDSPLVLVHIHEPTLSLSVLLWMKLSLLRLAAPRAHKHPNHYPVIPTPASSLTYNRATLALQTPELDSLLALSLRCQHELVGDVAKQVLRAAVQQQPAVWSALPLLRMREQLSLLAASPVPSLRSILSHAAASTSHVLQGAARGRDAERGSGAERRVERVVGLIRAAMERELERAREAREAQRALPAATPPSPSASSSSSPLLSRSPSHPSVPPTPRSAASAAPAAPSAFEGYSAELQKLLGELSTPLTSLAVSLRSFSLTTLTPSSSSLSVHCEHPDVSLQLVSFLALSEAELKADKAAAAAATPSSAPTWCIQMHADEQRTVLLKEALISADPTTRLFPPFLAPNPVYLSCSPLRTKQGQAKVRGKDVAEGQVQLSITPFTSHSLELLHLIVDALVSVRRLYNPQPLSPLSIAHVRRLEALLRSAYTALTDFLQRLLRALPLPSNLKLRAYESVAAVLACLTFSHLQVNAALKKERGDRDKPDERERERVQREREKDRAASAVRGAAREQRKTAAAVSEERKEGDDSHREELGGGGGGSIHQPHPSHAPHPHSHPPPHPHQPHLSRASSSSSSSSPLSPPSLSATASSGLPAAFSFQSELVDVSWLARSVVPEAKARHGREKPWAPLHSVYLQRLVELLVAALRYEKLVVNSRYWELKAAALAKGKRTAEKEGDGGGGGSGGKLLEVLRQPMTNELVLVLSVERLLLLATDPRAHPPLSKEGGSEQAKECECVWCRLLEDARDQTLMAMPLVDLSPQSLLHLLVHDMDCYSDSVITGVLHSQSSSIVSGEGANVPNAPPLSFVAAATSAFAGGLSSFSSIFGSNPPSSTHPSTSSSSSASAVSLTGSPSSAPAALPSAQSPQRSRSEEKTATAADDERSLARQRLAPFSLTAAASASTSTSTSSTVTTASSSSSSWRERLSLSERVLPSSSVRARIFNLLLNSTAHSSHARPEIAFRRGHDHSGDDASASSSTAGSASSSTGKAGAAAGDDESSLQRQSMFGQLCDAFLKAGFHRQASALRAEVSTVTWKTILAGALDQGAAGLPGPFRQALYEVCQSLLLTASHPQLTPHSLFIPCPNSRSQTGDDRHKLLVNPGLCGEAALVSFRIFGQLMGIAIRSKNCLDLDLAEIVWKQLLRIPLSEHDLPSFDFTAHRSLQFHDQASDAPFSEEDWQEYLGDLTYTTLASDNRTVLSLLPHGAAVRVAYHERGRYRRLATAARLSESCLQVSCIREGLHSIIPAQALSLLSWQELELRVCGRPTVDLDVLKRHTVYSPSTYSQSSLIVQHFWQVLHTFTQEEVAAFLQFAWARSRLPSEMGSYRMQLNILDKVHPMALPTAETCFFNVNLPKYSSVELMKKKIQMALHCGTITS